MKIKLKTFNDENSPADGTISNYQRNLTNGDVKRNHSIKQRTEKFVNTLKKKTRFQSFLCQSQLKIEQNDPRKDCLKKGKGMNEGRTGSSQGIKINNRQSRLAEKRELP